MTEIHEQTVAENEKISFEMKTLKALESKYTVDIGAGILTLEKSLSQGDTVVLNAKNAKLAIQCAESKSILYFEQDNKTGEFYSIDRLMFLDRITITDHDTMMKEINSKIAERKQNNKSEQAEER